MKLLSFATVTFLLWDFHPRSVLAGGIIASGGDITEGGSNPWFVSNTTTVEYCIKSDPASFGDVPYSLSETVKSAIQYWKGELLNSQNSSGSNVKIGTQNFVERDCAESPDVDLMFQFGVLSPEQQFWLQDPARLVAVAARTSYEVTSLRGKGFIYVSPDRGPLKMRANNMVHEPWHREKGILLKYVLMHELGHVFGFRHEGVAGIENFMAADFPEMALRADYADGVEISDLLLIENKQRAHFLDPPEYLKRINCSNERPSLIAQKFFGTDKPYRCFKVEVLQSEKLIRVSAGLNDDGVFETIGEARILLDSSSVESAVSVYLPDGQTVFQNVPGKMRSLLGPGFMTKVFVGSYMSNFSKNTIPIFLTLRPLTKGSDTFVLSTVVGDTAVPNILSRLFR